MMKSERIVDIKFAWLWKFDPKLTDPTFAILCVSNNIVVYGGNSVCFHLKSAFSAQMDSSFSCGLGVQGNKTNFLGTLSTFVS